MDVNWDHIRRVKYAKDKTPSDWPEGVSSISMEGMALLGIHRETGQLYWDGKEILTRTKIRLGTFERWVASFAAAGTFGTFVVNLGRALGYWD